MTKKKKKYIKKTNVFLSYIIKKKKKGTMATPDVHKKKIITTLS